MTSPQTDITILVVEDDPVLRLDAMDLVSAEGFIPVSATDAAEAVRVLEHRPDIPVVFTDIAMPGTMDGMNMARLISERWPLMKLVVVSGIEKPGDGDLPEGAMFFSKPYQDDDVKAALRALVAQNREASEHLRVTGPLSKLED